MTDVCDAAPTLSTLLWEADRLVESDLTREELQRFEAVAAFLDRVWPIIDVDLEPEDQEELEELRRRDAAYSNIFGALDFEEIDAAVRARLEQERAEGEKDATVPSRASSAERKAMRLLLERRLVVTRRESKGELAGLIVATCRGESGSYDLGYDPRGEGRWRCTCAELRGNCSHLAALKMIV